MPYIVAEFLLKISTTLLTYLKKYWKVVLIVVSMSLLYLYIQNIRGDLNEYKSKLQLCEENHKTYVKTQEDALNESVRRVADLQKSLNEKSKEVEREITIRNETINRITDSNNDLVGRLQQQSAENTLYYQSVPNIDLTLLSKYQSTSKSLVECSNQFVELAKESDQLSIALQGVEASVENYNQKVLELNNKE